MDSRQHHFFKSTVFKPLKMTDYATGIQASASAPCPGNDAIGTGAVTPVLNLEQGSGMAIETVNVGFPDFPFLLDVSYSDGGARARRWISENICNGGFFRVPQNHPYPVHFLYILGIDLCVATRDHNQGGWVEAMGPPDQLSGLVVRSMGDRACIDNVDIGRVVKWNDLKSIPLKACTHQCRVKLICFTPQRSDGNGFGHQESKWANSRSPRTPMASPTMIKTAVTPWIWLP